MVDSIVEENYATIMNCSDAIIDGLVEGTLEPVIEDSNISFGVSQNKANVGRSVLETGNSTDEVITDVRLVTTVDGVDFYQATYLQRANYTDEKTKPYKGTYVSLSTLYTYLENDGDSYYRVVNTRAGVENTDGSAWVEDLQFGIVSSGYACSSSSSTPSFDRHEQTSSMIAAPDVGDSYALYNTDSMYYFYGPLEGTGAWVKYYSSEYSEYNSFDIKYGFTDVDNIMQLI